MGVCGRGGGRCACVRVRARMDLCTPTPSPTHSPTPSPTHPPHHPTHQPTPPIRALHTPPTYPPPQRAMRTEPLGLDRHHRRYWWLQCDPGFVLVEDADGARLALLTSKEQLDEVRGVGGLVGAAGRVVGAAVVMWVLQAKLGVGAGRVGGQ